MGNAAEALEPRIYVACVAAYNSGQLHGAWISVVDDADAVREEIYRMLVNSPVRGAEEYAIHDYEDFGGVTISEYAGIDRVVELASFLRERGVLGAAVLEHLGGDVEAARDAFEDYCGAYPRLSDYFAELTEETVAIPEALRLYIDYEAMARDAVLGGEVFTVETAHDEVHVFWAR
ncbi:antirestriction protein [Caulobacter rhizosphaerae]|uniref:Antirestriction protein n=1 Tax=Caulobacter rhizosphaerae TaxID=2010972 RepID=A0ABU1MVK5_9CAUL|nr:antirestriction protein ArdA [Caulobacter rhizosphaerae]MDR6530223.1 antirestriction protein [Caulobacter rhizosphaerae]